MPRICGGIPYRQWRGCGSSDQLPHRPAVRHSENAERRAPSFSASLSASVAAKRQASMRLAWVRPLHPRQLVRARLGCRLPHGSSPSGGWADERDARPLGCSAVSGGVRYYRPRLGVRPAAVSRGRGAAMRPPNFGLANQRGVARHSGATQDRPCVPPRCDARHRVQRLHELPR